MRTLPFGLAALLAVSLHGQAQQDFSKVEIKTNKVSSNFYTLDGQGGTIGVLSGPDGVFMVDTQFAPLTEHTDGDTMVHFVNNDILMTGDFYRSIQFPNIDRANGGSLNGMLDGLALVIGSAGPNTKIIPGHGPTVNRAAVVAHRDMILAIRDRIAPQVQQGKTLEQVVASKPTADYEAKIDQAAMTGERFIGQVYAELKAAK